MAKDDIVVDLDSVGATSSIDFQPAAGVEVVITGGSSDTASGATFILTNATITSVEFPIGIALNGDAINKFRMFINNTNFLRRNNSSGGAIVMGFGGITTK